MRSQSSRKFPSFGIRKSGDLDILIANTQKSTMPISPDQGQLDAVPLVIKRDLDGEKQDLENLELVLGPHNRLLLLLRS